MTSRPNSDPDPGPATEGDSPNPHFAPSRIPPQSHDHYLGLQDATPVATTAALTTQAGITKAIERRSMMCIHGDVGLGKTFAVHAALRELAPHTLRLSVRQGANMSEIRGALWRALRLQDDPPQSADLTDQAITGALRHEPRVLLCDEAHWLSPTALEYFLYLWNDHTIDMSIVFVGAENTRRKIHDRRALASRVNIWQQFSPLTPQEVLAAIPLYHPVWRDADSAEISRINTAVCHGSFRNWANLTLHIRDGMEESPNPDRALNRDLIDWAVSQLDSSFRSTRV